MRQEQTANPEPTVQTALALVGMDLAADALAAVTCCFQADWDGLRALAHGTEKPRQLAGMIAALSAGLLVRGGATGAAADPILATARMRLADQLLDRPLPDRAVLAGHGMDLVADSIAAVRCMAGDRDGLMAILNGNEEPRALVGAIAALAAELLRLGAATDQDAEALLSDAGELLSEVRPALADLILEVGDTGATISDG